MTIDILPIFIRDVLFHRVGFYWVILTREQYEFYLEENFIEWCTGGPYFNEICFQNLHVTIFEELFVIAC